jgi:hypothetical protein
MTSWVFKIHVQTIEGKPLRNMQVELTGSFLKLTDANGDVWAPMETGHVYDLKVRDQYSPHCFGPTYDPGPGDFWYHAYATKVLDPSERHVVKGSDPPVYGVFTPVTVYPIVVVMKQFACPPARVYAAPNACSVVATTCETRCGCSYPKENFPYHDETFELVKQMAELVNNYAKKYNVPPVAIAGSIADEYNTRTGFKAMLDWLQDDVVISNLPNWTIKVDVFFGFNSRLLNSTKNDLGVGNIKLETAKKIYDAYRDQFANTSMNYADLVAYIMTNEGTIHLTTLYLAEAMRKLDPYMNGYTPEKKEAVYVTYFKQGPDNYMSRFEARLKVDSGAQPKPGEGCRVCLQRERMLLALDDCLP